MQTRYSNEDIDTWFSYSVDIRKRCLYMSSVNFDGEGKEMGVDSEMTEYVLKGLHILENKKPITIMMNNIGGDWFHGMAIYDAIRTFPSHVTIEVYGHAMSMGSVILQAADRRVMHANATLMIHDGLSDSGARPVQSARNWSNYDEAIRKRMYEIYGERSDQYPSYWKKKCSHDYLMNAEKAVEEGLADEVAYPNKKFQRRNKKK